MYVWFCLLLDKCVHMHPCARPFNSELNISLVPRRKVTRNEASSIYTCLHIDVCVCMYYNAICVYVHLFILGQVCTHMSTSKASHVTCRSMYISALVCMYVCMYVVYTCVYVSMFVHLQTSMAQVHTILQSMSMSHTLMCVYAGRCTCSSIY